MAFPILRPVPKAATPIAKPQARATAKKIHMPAAWVEPSSAKAKEARRVAERLITLGKKGDIHSRRLALSRIPNRDAVTKLFNEIAPKIERNSGYLRVMKTRHRSGDNACMAILEFVDYDKIKAASEPKEEKADKKAS